MSTTITADEVRRWLAEIPELVALLPMARITKPTGVQTRRPIPSSRPPVNLALVHLTDRRHKEHWTEPSGLLDPDRKGVLPYLDDWCQDLHTTALDGDPIFDIPPRDIDPPPDEPTITGMCSWLAAHADWAATLPQWPELADGVRITWSRLRTATRSVRDRSEQPVPCNVCGAGQMRRVDGTKPLWECGTCGRTLAVQAVTLRQAAKIIGVSKSTLYPLAQRNLLEKVADGREVLYDLGSVRRVVAEAKLRGAG